MAIDPKKWLYSVLDIFPSALISPVRHLVDKLFGVLQDAVDFARWIGEGARNLYLKASTGISRLVQYAIEVAVTIEWIVTVYLPQRLIAGLNTLKAYAVTLVTATKNALLAGINAIKTFTTTELGKLKALVGSAINTIIGAINAIKAVLSNTVAKWYDRLTDPVKFVEWLLAPLIKRLLRYIYDNREKIIKWFFTESPAFAIWVARQIESVLVKML